MADAADINLNFHEIWWIYSDGDKEWNGLRLAHFRKTVQGDVIVYIQGEVDRRRLGPRVWDDIKGREGWQKIMQVPIPTADQIRAALRAA